jgi:hypothetical protein
VIWTIKLSYKELFWSSVFLKYVSYINTCKKFPLLWPHPPSGDHDFEKINENFLVNLSFSGPVVLENISK